MANLYTDIKLFDAEYYLANNPDVAAAIQGTDITAQDHYFLHGAAESLTGGTENGSRAPNAWFNAAEYVAQNPDLADVDANLLLAHFALHGVNEGRAPNAATAGEDGKIKPELLADYVNAEGNEDVKAAIAEITGTPVGAELTAEQAAIAMQHFFTYGITEGREGGIADVINQNDGNGADEDAIAAAIDNYTETLEQLAAAEEAQQEAIAAAKAANLTDKDDADEVAGDIATAIKGKLAVAVREAAELDGNSLVAGEVTDAKIEQAQKALEADVTAKQAALNAHKENAAKVVALQEQLLAQKQAVDAAEEVNLAFEAEVAKFDKLNKLTSEEEGVTLVEGSELKATVGNFELSFDEKGKVQVNAAVKQYKGKELAHVDLGLTEDQLKNENENENGKPGVWVDVLDADGTSIGAGRTDNQDSSVGNNVALLYPNKFKESGEYTLVVKTLNGDKAGSKTLKEIKLTVVVEGDEENVTYTFTAENGAEEFGKLKGAEDLIAAFEAVKANEKALDKANANVQNAAIEALKAEGYKLYSVKDDKVVKAETNWTKAIEDGVLKEDFVIVNADLKVGETVPSASESVVVIDNNSGALFTPAEQSVKAGEGSGAQLSINGDELTETSLANSGLEDALGDIAEGSEGAAEALKAAQEQVAAFEAAVKALNDAKALQAELADATEAVEAAAEAVKAAADAFEELGVSLVQAVKGEGDDSATAKGTVFDEDDEDLLADLFVYAGEALTVENFDGNDKFYFGTDNDFAFKVVDSVKDIKANADATAFEIFAVQEDGNTVLYVEKEAFAGSSSNAVDVNDDLVKIELVGVNAEDLQFNDGFLTLA